MKKVFLIIFFCFAVKCDVCFAQGGEWTWVKGDSTAYPNGNYGTMGIADSTNAPPGLYEPAWWKDLNGNFWILGGYQNLSTYATALWKYEPLTNQWTWIKGPSGVNMGGVYGTMGIPAVNNYPGSRYGGIPTWIDSSGNLWLYGGWGLDATGAWAHLSDVWKYDPFTNEWTWMNGSQYINASPYFGTYQTFDQNVTPGQSGESTCAWKDDNDNFWLYGGLGINGSSSAMFKYDYSINEWAWMWGGASFINVNYGVQGISSPTNSPGARWVYAHWKDVDGKMWIAGGMKGYVDFFSDVWRFDPLIYEWTWIAGSNVLNDSSSHGIKCDTLANYFPASRMENSSCWTDLFGNFWVYGGSEADYESNPRNDLWCFQAQSLRWIWVSGDSSGNPAGEYGTQGISASTNIPPSRSGSTAWIDCQNDLWFFGGTRQPYGIYNDMWKFQVNPDCIPGYQPLTCTELLANFHATNDVQCVQICTDFIDQSLNSPTTWQWLFPGASPSSSTDQNPTNICYNTPGTYDVTLITSNAYGSDTLTLTNYITVYAAPSPPVITQSNDTLTSSAAYSYQWFMNGSMIPGATNQQLIITQSGNYSATITDSLGCSASDTIAAVLLLPQSAFNSSAISGCPGIYFDFTNASLNATTYQWFFTGGNPASSSQQNPSNICYANPGVYDVTLIASSNFASDTLEQAAYITIFTPLAISISQNGNFLTCNPAAASYQWSLNGYQIPGATSQALFINQTGTFTIDVIDSNGCFSSDTLAVNNIPSPNFSTPDITVCEKFCTDFFDQSSNNPSAWQWIFSGGDPVFSSEQNPTNICYDVPGVFDVTLITTNANGNDTLTLPNYITVYPTPPFPTISQVGYTLTSSPASSYQWQFNSIDIPGATNQSYTILQTGYYTVVVSDSNGCVNSLTVYTLISGIDDVMGDGNISIYPNPSSGSFMVEFSYAQASENGWLNGPDPIGTGEVSIDVMNVLGQKVFSWSEKTNGDDFRKEIDLSNEARGVYFIEIKSENTFLKRKIIITN